MPRVDFKSTATGAELLPRAGDAEASIHIPTSALFYEAAIEGLTRMNQEILQLASFPALYESGVRYRKEENDTWRHADDVLCSGWGDCEDLAAWRAAELRVSGEDPAARVYVYRSGPRRFHAVVARGDGRLEDPSVLLGMPVSEARRAQLPRWEGDEEMNDTTPRQFAACPAAVSEDILSRGAVGMHGVLLTDPPSNETFSMAGWGSRLRSLARPRLPGLSVPGHVLRALSPVAVRSARGFLAGQGDEAGSGDNSGVGGIDEGGNGDIGDDAEYYDDSGADEGYGEQSQYADEYPEDAAPAEEAPAEPAAPSGPNPIERALSSAGKSISSAARSAWDTAKDVVSPISFGAKLAVAPIKTVAKASQLVHKYGTMPFKALNKVFSFLGEDGGEIFERGLAAPHASQVGVVDDEDYAEGDEEVLADIFEAHPDDLQLYDDGAGESYVGVPRSQTARFATDEVAPGVWQGQVVLPSKTPGKSVTLTTTPAPDEASAADRMYNLSLKAAQSPAMMALLNPLAFATLMTMKGAGKVPFGSVFKSIGSGISSAARAVGRGAESLAQTASSW